MPLLVEVVVVACLQLHVEPVGGARALAEADAALAGVGRSVREHHSGEESRKQREGKVENILTWLHDFTLLLLK